MKDETQEQDMLNKIARIDNSIIILSSANLSLLERLDETKKDKVKSMSRQFDMPENEANQDLSDSSAMTLRPTESLANTDEVYDFERMPESLEEVQKCLIKLETMIENSTACVEHKDLGDGYHVYLVKNDIGGASLDYVRGDHGLFYKFHFQYREFGGELIKTAIDSTQSFYSNKPLSIYNIGVATKDTSFSSKSTFIYADDNESYYAQDGKLDIDKANAAAQIAYDQLAGYLEQFDIRAPGYKGKDTSSSESVTIDTVKPGSAIEQKNVELKTMEDVMGHISKIMDKLNDDPRFEKSTFETDSHTVNSYSYETEDKNYCVTCSTDDLLCLNVTNSDFDELNNITFHGKNFSISLEHKIQMISNSNRGVLFYSDHTPKVEFDKLAMEAYADIKKILRDQLGIELD